MVHIVSPTAPAQSSESQNTNVGKLSSNKLLNRPPTPPREATKALSSPQQSSTGSQQEALNTPTSSTESTNQYKKQVNWSPWTKYHKPDDPSPLRPSRPSSSVSTPLKSILKPFNPSVISIGLLNSSDQIKAYTYDSFPAMLESITQALASTERSKKLDTYVTFCNTLKAYDNNPDMKAIKNKMPLLSSFIRRDLGARLPNSTNNSGDSQLIQQAIKLLTIFVWLPELAESIDDDDAVFFIQHAIQVLKDPQSPKVVVTYFLAFLGQQKFPPKIMTPERASGIIQTLKDIENRVVGNTVLTERIGIYQRLLSQARPVMVVRTWDWMEHVLSAVLSNANNKDLRMKALNCMTEAARTIGSEKTVARSLTSLLNREDNDGVKLFERVTERLSLFIKNGEGVHVTQVWGLVVLLLRGRHPVSLWEHFTPWLNVIQQCFNSSTVAIKVAANAAWSKLIYVLHCGPEIIRKDMDLLTRPLARYLDPQYAGTNSKGTRQAALSNVCAFIYYNIRPNASIKQISLAWDVIIVGLIERLVLSGKHEVEDACRILAALFDGSHQRPWNESRGLDKEAIKADEILRIDPKWVRSNSALVLKTLETAIRKSPWEGDDCAIKLLWRKFTKCLADASMKEIKVSAETMEAIAHIFNMLQKLWKEGPSAFVNISNKSSDGSVEIITFLIITAFESIGTVCFTEKQLSYDDHNEFNAISTPSNRYSSGGSYSAVFHPPIVHLFQLFLKPFNGAELSEQYFGSAKSILENCLNAQDSRRKRLALLSACSTVLPQRGTSIVDKQAWSILAILTESALLVKEKPHSSPIPVSWEFKDVLKILQWGCRYDIPAWNPLFDTFAQIVQVEQGDVQLISTLIEPLAEFLRLEKLDSDSRTWLTHGKTILEKSIYPKSRVQGESSAKVPYGWSSKKIANTEPYDNLYNMVNQFLVTAYPVCEDVTLAISLKEFFETLIEFMHRCPKSSVLVLLKRIQEGLAVWIADAMGFLNKKNSDLAAKMQRLWVCVTDAIKKLPRHDSIALQSLATLIAVGLESKRKIIVNSTIMAWNDTFGTQNSLEYPARVRIVMKKLRPIADISLPTFPEDVDEIVPTPPVWEESQESQENPSVEPPLWSSPTPAPSRHRDRTTSPLVDSISSPTRNFLTRMKGVSSKTAKPKARLNHMDSQLDFAPIATTDSQSEAIDSQLLTEHQKEVRDRQHEEAANLFSDIGLEQAGKSRKERPFSRTRTQGAKVARQIPRRLFPESSPSLPDEFVDAPEGDENESLQQEEAEFAQEQSNPATKSIVQVPKRHSGKAPNRGTEPWPSDEACGDQNLTDRREGELKVTSNYFTAPKGNAEPSGIEEPDLKGNTLIEHVKETEIENITSIIQGDCSVKSSTNDSEVIADSLDINRVPATQLSQPEAPSIGNHGPESERLENSASEVPDSFVRDSQEGTEIRMTDSNDALLEEAAVVHVTNQSPPFESQVPNQYSMEVEEETKKRVETRDEVVVEELGTSKQGQTKKGRRVSTKKRKSLQIQTTSTTNKEEEPILDCIMVTPKKVPSLRSVPETVLRNETIPNSQTAAYSQASPLTARKRKQRTEPVEEVIELEPKSIDHPPKRRATRGPKSTPLQPTVESVQPTIESPAENSQPLDSPMLSTKTVSTKGKGRGKTLTSEHPDIRQPRSSRRRNPVKEEIVLDSQPEVVATPPPAAHSQRSQSLNPKEGGVNVSFVTDSNASVSQAVLGSHVGMEQTESKKQMDSKSILSNFKNALAALAEADFEAAELREAEDEVFEVYVKLREKRRRK